MRTFRFFILALCWASAAWAAGQHKYDYFFAEAEKCRLAEDYASAFELYRHCLELRPQSAHAAYNLGLLYMYMQQDSLGLEHIRLASRLQPANPQYLEVLGSYYAGKGDVAEATHTMEQLVALQPKRVDLLSQLWGLYESQGKAEEALRMATRIEQLEGVNPRLSVEKYKLLSQLGRKDEAFAELHRLCQEYPHDQNCKLVLASELFATGDSAQALLTLNQVRAAEPHHPTLQVVLRDYYRNLPDIPRYHQFRDSVIASPLTSPQLMVEMMEDMVQEAEADSALRPRAEATLDSLLALPQEGSTLLALKLLFQSKTGADEDQMAATLRLMVEADPKNRRAISMLVKYYFEQQRYEDLENVCRVAVNQFPDDLRDRFYLGMALYYQNKLDQTLETFEQATRIKNSEGADERTYNLQMAEIYSMMGDLYHMNRQKELGYAAYDSALAHDEGLLSCLNNYAYFLSLDGERLDKAEEMSYRTIRAKPQEATYLDTYAWVLFRMGQYAQARIYIDRVVPPPLTDEALLAPGGPAPTVLEHAGDIYYMLGEKEAAIRLWGIALKKSGDEASPALVRKNKEKKYVK